MVLRLICNVRAFLVFAIQPVCPHHLLEPSVCLTTNIEREMRFEERKEIITFNNIYNITTTLQQNSLKGKSDTNITTLLLYIHIFAHSN